MGTSRIVSSREIDVELDAVAWAENNGWLVRKIAYVGRANCPDRLFVGYGHIVLIELKKAGKEPRIGQVREFMRFEDRGVTVHVADTDAEAIRILTWCMDHDQSPLTFG